MTPQELVVQFRKETEDLVNAIINDMFLMKHGEIPAQAGLNTVIFTDAPYDSAEAYLIGIHEAIDNDQVDVRGELTIQDQTANGFKIWTERPCMIKWISTRRVPKINFWT